MKGATPWGESKAARVLVLLFRLVVAAVFLSSGFLKLIDPRGFAEGIYAYEIFGATVSNLVAVTLPWVELATGLLILTGLLLPESSLISAGMLLAFTGAIVSVMVRGLDLENCACNVPFFSEAIGARKIVENLLLLGICLWLFAVSLKRRLARASHRGRSETVQMPEAARRAT